ncbi:DHA2 family efflux MFS transporter permease subunit [Canibacter zhoujuaniae]|uniref:DHA2 family efflux MFS transporter permease subunit n=1 Tax=Canibacter zhoujuaniae TaxID=2708343 RepID=UPI001422B42D|nr:DHA2 family efflux MFS transporter permease subunit [Canibacter zhoujuaniae]
MNSNKTVQTVEPAAKRWWALAILVLACLLVSIDNTVLFIAVPALSQDLQPSANQLLWISDSYTLVIAGLLVTMGNLADRIGRKKLLLIGSAAFGLSSILAAYATTPEMLICARALMGAAGANLMPSTLALIRNIFIDDRERTRAIAIWASAFGVGGVLGPVLGGFILEHFHWGAVFLINVPVMVILIILGALLLPESKNPNPGSFDVLSSLLSLVTMVSFVYAIKHFAHNAFDWITLTTLMISVIGGTVFVRRQLRQHQPMMDVYLFRIRAFTGANLINMVAIFGIIGLNYFFSQYLQFLRGYSPLTAGFAELPIAVAQLVLPALVGFFIARFAYRGSIAGGMLLTAGAFALLAYTVTLEPYWPTAVALGLLGFGAATAMSLTNDVILSAVPPERAGAASAISETGFELGAAFGIAVMGSVINSVYNQRLQLPAGVDSVSRETISESLAGAVSFFDDQTIFTAVNTAYVQAVQMTLLVAAALCVCSAIIAWFTVPRRISSVGGEQG